MALLRQACLVGFLSFIFFVIFTGYTKLGYNIHYKKHHPGDCRQVKGLEYGSEDLQVTGDGLAFITSGVDFPCMAPKYHALFKENNLQGRMYLFDFNKQELGAQQLKIKPSKNFEPKTFRPHGMSLLEDKAKGEHLIYVVNHPEGGLDRVEKFRFLPKEKQLEHLRFFNDSKLLTANDIALISEDHFYITNYLYFHSHALSLLEHIFPLGFGGVLYFDGNQFIDVETGLSGANGALLSSDKKFLYVALPFSATMHVYEVEKSNSLKLVQKVPEVHTSIDNFHLGVSGDSLLGGAHPVGHRIAKHLHDPHLKAPSSVLRLPLSNGRVVHEEITELFYDHGDLISGSSVAAIYGNQLLIGSVIDKLAICDLYGKIPTKIPTKPKGGK